MSSHHFVKEGQEPALFIVNALSLEQVEPLLEWAPLVMVSEDALDDVLRWGIKIDAVLTNHQDESLTQKLEYQHPVSIISFNPADDFVKVGIDFLQSRKSSAVNVMCDVTVQTFASAHTRLDFQCSLLNRDARWSLIRNRHFEKWLEAGSKLLVYTQTVNDIEFEGLERRDSEGNFVSPRTGVVKIRGAHDFWIGELF